MSPPPPPPPASPPPPPPPPGFNIGAPAPGSFGTSPPTTTAGGLQFASAGGANFSGNGPGPAPGVVFAANQTALKIGSTSIAADTAANAQSFTATVIDPGTADVQFKIPSLGIDQAINVDDPNGDIKLSNGQYLRLQSFNTNPLIEWALIGEWRIDGAANANPAEIGTYVVGYQTPTASVPRAGTASYVDPFGVDAEAFYPRANGALPYTQVFISGGVNLQVNFVNGSVTGAFNNLQAFASTGVAPWNVVTVSGTISGNGISGTTTSANPPANNLAFGSGTGSIKGGFYGPAADEVAGTWTLSDGTNSAIGVFGSPTGTGSPVILPATIGAPEKATVGTTLPTTAGAGLELAAPGGPEFTDAFGGPLAIPVGTTFALTESTLKLTKTAVAADTATDAAGATVTSTEIGLSQSELKIPNLNVDATTRFTPSAATLPDGRVVSITSHATLDYVQLGEWSVGATAANPTSELGDFVLGYQTPLGSMPTVGSATYSRVGGVVGDIVTPPSAAQFGNAPYQSTGVQGDVSLTANFAAGTVTGAFTDMNEGGGVPISALAFNDIGVSATISGDAFSGTTKVTSTPLNTVGFGSNATGTIAGGFYGRQANDIGAVWTLYDGQNALIGTVGASMTSESGLPGGPLSAPCCGPSPAPGLAAFTYVNTG